MRYSNTLTSILKNQVGQRVRLINCNDRYTRLDRGALGTVVLVDCNGTVHVDWDDGTRLGLCYEDGDRWEVVRDRL